VESLAGIDWSGGVGLGQDWGSNGSMLNSGRVGGSNWSSNGNWGSQHWGGVGLGDHWGGDRGVLDGSGVRSSNWSGNGHWGGVGSDSWGSQKWGGVGLGDHWSSDGNWSGEDWAGDGSGGWGLGGINAWLVGRDGGSVSEGIGNVVHSSHSAIGISETIGTNLHSWTSLFLSEGTTGSVVFVVAEGVVAQTILRSGHGRGASVDDGWHGSGGSDDGGEHDEEFHFWFICLGFD